MNGVVTPDVIHTINDQGDQSISADPLNIQNSREGLTPTENSCVKNAKVPKKRTPMKQLKITSVFKRKMSPGKEADSLRENIKVSRNDNSKS